MTRVENDCVDCESHMRQCSVCGLRRAKHLYCDECGNEIGGCEIRFSRDGDDLCSECARESMLCAIGGSLDTTEIYELIKNAGFDDYTIVKP